MKKSKRYIEAKSQVDSKRLYQAEEALNLVKGVANTEKTKVNFDQSVEVVINLNLKAKHTVRGTLIFPQFITKVAKKILVFAKGEKVSEAEAAGATYIGDISLIEKIKGGWFDFDVAIATPDMMKDIGKLGPLLGRRGLMPNPKTGTVTLELANAINDFKKGKEEFRADKTGIVHMKIGQVSMDADKLFDNAKALYKEVLNKKPSDLKGEYIRSIAFSTTMGPGVRIIQHSLS